MTSELQIYIDGEYYPKSQAKISVYDHGFLYGDGVFEGIRAYNGLCFQTQRARRSPLPFSPCHNTTNTAIKRINVKAVVETLRRNQMKDAYIRLIVSRGVGDLGLDPRKCPKPTIIIIADTINIKARTLKKKALQLCSAGFVETQLTQLLMK
jgi:branched-chain amino acid aminotransferase